MFGNKISLKDCELELKNLILYLQSDMCMRKNFKEFTVDEVLFEYDKYNQIACEDGWGTPSPYYMKKLNK